MRIRLARGAVALREAPSASAPDFDCAAGGVESAYVQRGTAVYAVSAIVTVLAAT